MSTDLLHEIDAFLAERKIGDHRFGVLAINNGRLLERLRSGGRIWPETADKIRRFIELEREALCTKSRHAVASSKASVSDSISPGYLPSGEAVARCEVRPRATATNSGEAR